MGFWGPWRHCIGSIHLRTRAVTAIKLAENIVGFGKLTAGLQGSLIPTGIGVEYGQVGSFTYHNASYLEFGKPFAAETNVSAMVLTEKPNRMWGVRYTTAYMNEVNTLTGSITKTIPVPNSGMWSVDFARDKHRFWGITRGSPTYLYEFGTTTGAVIGSRNITSTVGTVIAGISIDDNYNLYILNYRRHYIYKMGTAGNLIGSLRNTDCGNGIGWDTVHKHLWSSSYGVSGHYILLIGTTTGNTQGSFVFNPDVLPYDPKWDANNGDLWVFGNTGDNFFRVDGYDKGTYAHFSAPFSSSPTVVATQVGNQHNLGVRVQQSSLGSVRIDANPGTIAKANWIAVGV